MKLIFVFIHVSIYIMIMQFQFTFSAKIPLEKEAKKDEIMSDKELDELLKDPKYAALAKDLDIKPDTKLPTPSKPPTVLEHSSPSIDKKNELLKSSHMTKDLENTHPSKDFDMSKGIENALRIKDIEMSGMKHSHTINHPIMPSPPKIEEKKSDQDEDKFQGFDFISKQQARYIIEVLKQPAFFNHLPNQAKQIVKQTQDNFSFKLVENEKLAEFTEVNIMNSRTSQAFTDSDGMIGRKGILSIVDPVSGDSRFVWAVANSKVFCFFQSQDMLTIVKIFRNSSLKLKDVNASPCFLVYSFREQKDGSILVCSSSTQEKEIWIQTLTSHLAKQT